MLKTNRNLLALAVMSTALCTGVAQAAPLTGPYIAGGAGYDLTQTQHGHFSPGADADGLGGTGGGSAGFRHAAGYTGFGSVGWGFGNGFRVEAEGAYTHTGLNHVSHSAATGRTSGHDQSYGGLLNVIYDVDLKQDFGLDTAIKPYVGVGAGYLWTDLQNASTQYAQGGRTRWSGSRGSFAYQGIVGASYDVPSVPGLAVTADYRMTSTDFSNGSYNSGFTGAAGMLKSGHVNFDERFNHQFTVGLRYAFDTAPPAPQYKAPVVPTVVAPPPAPAPARSFLVFFDFDSAALNDRSVQIVDQAARNAAALKTTRIELDGYTDSSSAHGGKRGKAYNLKLSQRRAQTVGAELVRSGVPANEIVIQAFGEEHPLVPTGPNVREPQNRRVEIIIH